MNNIYQYIEQYGKYSFQEKELNEVDAMIFSFLTYANYQKILKKDTQMTIQEIGDLHPQKYPKNNNDIIAVKDASHLLKIIKDTNRYKDCSISNYEYIGNQKIQFSAMSIEYKKNHIFVAFEGTDALFSGWIENFLLSCEFPTASHKKAIEYLNHHFTFSRKSLVIGGHSKGGNLSLVAGMYANPLVRLKIKKVYNGDGPGLLEKEFNSWRYRMIQKKCIHIIPDYAVVGILLKHSNDTVIHSSTKSILAHDITTWEVIDQHFKRSSLSTFSKELDKEVMTWIETKTIEERKNIIQHFEKILEKTNITSINEIKENNLKIMNILHESREIDNATKKAISELIKIIIKCIEKTQKEELKLFINNLFKREPKK